MSKIKPIKLHETLYEYMKKKRMVLQRDAGEELNRYIGNASIKLEEQGKIKRYKIKVRQPMGNLNDLWLLCMPDVDYNKVIDYEKEMVNKPYRSPLEENHFYKKGENRLNKFKDQETGEIIKLVKGNNVKKSENVINLSEYVTVINKDINIKEYNGQRVVTSYDISILHNKPVGKVNEILRRNVDRFELNEDYFIISRENFKNLSKVFEKLFTSNKQKESYLFTERGYLLLVKTFEDDLSWTVQRELVNTYFKVKQLKQDQTINQLPQIQNINSLDMFELVLNNFKEQNQRIETLENKINTIVQVLSS